MGGLRSQMRPKMADFKLERARRAYFRTEREDLRPERADFWSVREDLRPERVYLRPERAELGLRGRI